MVKEDPERAANRRRYWQAMGDVKAAQLEAARAELVKRYWDAPQAWPNGLGDWYRAEDWALSADKKAVVRVGGVAVSGRDLARWEIADRQGRLEPAPRAPPEQERGEFVEAPRPWEAEGVSRRTWYRRRAAPAK